MELGTGAATMGRFLNKLKIVRTGSGLKIEPPCDPAISPLGIYLEKTKPLNPKDICTPVFTATLLTITKTQKQPKCPLTDEGMKSMWYIDTIKCYSAMKMNEIMPSAATWLDLEMIILSQTEKENII